MFAHLKPHSSDFGDNCALSSPFLVVGVCTPVVVCVARTLRPRLSYSGRRDRSNSVLLCTLDKGGGGTSDSGATEDRDAVEIWHLVCGGRSGLRVPTSGRYAVPFSFFSPLLFFLCTSTGVDPPPPPSQPVCCRGCGTGRPATGCDVRRGGWGALCVPTSGGDTRPRAPTRGGPHATVKSEREGSRFVPPEGRACGAASACLPPPPLPPCPPPPPNGALPRLYPEPTRAGRRSQGQWNI